MIDSESFIYLKTILALIFVIGLIFLFAAVVKKTGLDKKLSGNLGGAKRLSVVETMYLDPKRRIVIVKCDNKEHVLLLGATDVLIESRDHGEKT
jgi:flagellar protein FliO/FliZ